LETKEDELKKEQSLSELTRQSLLTHIDFGDAFRPFLELQNTIAKALESIILPSLDVENIFKNIAESLRPALELHNLIDNYFRENQQYITTMLAGFQKGVELYKDSAEKFKYIIVELGWPPTDILYPEELTTIVEEYSKHGCESIRKDVDAFFLNKFDLEEINLILERWESTKALKSRLPILQQAINAHLEGNYYLSVPALLPQIEGIIADGYAHYGRMNGKNLGQYFKVLLSDTDMLSFDIAALEFLSQYILVDFVHGLPPKSSLSRHAILHGADTNYGTATNSLKCILLLDYLQDSFGYVSIGNGNSYHLIGCPVVLNFKVKYRNKGWVVYKDKNSAHKSAKLPCKICKP
jgi:hypothetical protein